MAAPLRGAVHGFGHMGRLHVERLHAMPGVEVRPVDPALGLEGWPGRPDFAVVAVPASIHGAVAGELLARKIPCLVEKPLAWDPEEARLLADHPHCMPAHIERFNPVFDVLEPGDVRYLQAERTGAPTGRGQDVDVVRDLMIHDLDLAGWLIGWEVEDLRAVGLAVPRQPGEPAAGPDIANARLEMAGGGVATLTASRVSRKGSRTLRLVTTEDYWSVDLREKKVDRVRWSRGELEARRVPVPPGPDALTRELEAFLGAVRGGAPFPVAPGDGYRSVLTAWRVLEAMNQHERRV